MKNLAVCSLQQNGLAPRQLAEELGVPIISNISENYDFLLVFSQQGMYLQQQTKPIQKLEIDYISGTFGYRRQQAKSTQLIAKAVGLHKKSGLTIIDATAGLGHDGLLLAILGCQVTMLERSKILYALVKDALERFESQSELDITVQIKQANAIEYLCEKANLRDIDVIYLDPMFPERSKSALVKKEMRILRELVGDDLDAVKLLEIALASEVKRVVVKRPRKAPLLSHVKPSYSLSGKSSRFDIYQQL